MSGFDQASASGCRRGNSIDDDCDSVHDDGCVDDRGDCVDDGCGGSVRGLMMVFHNGDGSSGDGI